MKYMARPALYWGVAAPAAAAVMPFEASLAGAKEAARLSVG